MQREKNANHDENFAIDDENAIVLEQNLVITENVGIDKIEDQNTPDQNVTAVPNFYCYF